MGNDSVTFNVEEVLESSSTRSIIESTQERNSDPHDKQTIKEDEDWELEQYDGSIRLLSLKDIWKKLTSIEGWFGDYDWGSLCMPQLPFSFSGSNEIKPAPFFGLDDELPILLGLICGLQHCLAMLAGVVAPPIILSSLLGFDGKRQNQMVATSLISSAILSLLQMSRFRIPRTRTYVGSGLLTVVGVSFANISVSSAVLSIFYNNGICSMTDGVRNECPDGYAYLLGTTTLCSLMEMGLSFIPIRKLKKMFPPLVVGTVVFLIGASLVGQSGFQDWGGGSTCYGHPTTGPNQLCPSNTSKHALKWGDARYLGLGFASWVTILICEFCGSPAMKSASIIIGLIVGCIIAGPAGYIDGVTVREARVATFLWVDTYKLKLYAPAILPNLVMYMALAMEATGDITASSEASRQPVSGTLFESRVQGGILADGVNGMLSGFFMNLPASIFAQNNGVIAITRCASRTAGYFCCFYLLIFGILAKISGVFLAIPKPVLGGVTTFLFTSVCVSGLKVCCKEKFTRKNTITLISALSIGIGDLLVPDWGSFIFTYKGDNHALQGFMNAIVIILTTPYLISGIIAIILYNLLPEEPEEPISDFKKHHSSQHAHACNTNAHDDENDDDKNQSQVVVQEIDEPAESSNSLKKAYRVTQDYSSEKKYFDIV